MQTLSKFYVLTQKDGLLAALNKVWTKTLSHTDLQIRAAWWRFTSGRLPSNQEVLKGATRKWKNLDELVDHFCNQATQTYLFSTADREAYLAVLRERYPANVQETIRRAENIVQHRFQLLGSNFEFSNNIDWHLDPESGHSWPKEFYKLTDRWMWSETRFGDSKLPWELNRHQYFFTLGKAYWLTGDERYAEECADQVLSWIRNNPQGIGIHWYSALEIGIRIISWALAFHFFRNSPRFLSRAGKPFLKSLYQQTGFLRKNLSLKNRVRNNHIIGEVTGLIVMGILFSEFEEASDWLHTGLQILEQEISLQTFPDGANKEQATSYQRFVLDFLILVIVMTKRAGIPLSGQLEKQLEMMLNHVMFITKPDGTVPMLGDADDGRGFVFDDGASFWDFRDSLAAGAVLCQRPDFKFVAQDFGEEAFWLLGPEGLKNFEKLEADIPGEVPHSFSHAGQYVIRDSWNPDSDYAFFKCGLFGLGGDGSCSHSHCDLLSFVLCLNGVEVIVDSGTYAYHGPWRDPFRLTMAHNTIMIDDYDQAKPRLHFGWMSVPSAECLIWDGNKVLGSMQTVSGVTHQRGIYHPGAGSWDISDHLKGDGLHKVSWFFHFAPQLTLISDSSNQIMISKDGNPFATINPPDHLGVKMKTGWYSQSYLKKVSNPVVEASWNGNIPTGGVTFTWKFQTTKLGEPIK